MPRNLSPSVLAAIDAPQKSLALFLQLTFGAASTTPTATIIHINMEFAGLVVWVTNLNGIVAGNLVSLAGITTHPELNLLPPLPVLSTGTNFLGPFMLLQLTGEPDFAEVDDVGTVTLEASLYLWSGIGTISSAGPAWDPGATFPYGLPFIGMGWLGRIDSVPQNAELTAENLTLQLSGIPSELLGDVVNTVRLNGVASLWLGFFSNGQLLADPLALWKGALDVPTVSDGAETCAITITVENALIALNLASNRRFTTLDQQLDFPGDTGFDYVSAMQNLYLPFPCAILSTQNVHSPSDAPDGTNSVTVAPPGPLLLSLGSPVLQVLGSAFFISGQYWNTTQNVTSVGLWSSSDTGVAVVSNGHGANLLNRNFGVGGGLITATGVGNCTITFNFGSASCSLTVTVVAT